MAAGDNPFGNGKKLPKPPPLDLPPLSTTKSGVPKPPSVDKGYAVSMAAPFGDASTMNKMIDIDASHFAAKRQARQKARGTFGPMDVYSLMNPPAKKKT